MKLHFPGIKFFSSLCLMLGLTAFGPSVASAFPGSLSHNLFVANIGNGNGQGSITEITTNGTQFLFAANLDDPYGMAFDPAGNLYVADYGSDTIFEYTNGFQLSQAPLVFANNLNGPVGLAFDSHGNLYEADSGSGTIFEFTNGYTLGHAPIAFATNFDSLVSLTGLAFDQSGNLFAGNDGSGTIFEFTNSYQPGQLPVTFADNLFAPTGLAFDRWGNLFVTDGDGTLYEFGTNGTQSVFASDLNFPTGLAFDIFGRLFEGDFGSGNVYRFATNGVQSTFATGLNPTFVAFDPVAEVPTTITENSSANPAVFGQSVTLTATISPVSASANTPTGTVQFFDGVNSLGSVTVSNRMASLTVSSLGVGSHNIQLTYSGDANFITNSTVTNQVIIPAGTVSVLGATPNPSVYGQPVVLTATVSAAAPGAGTVAGSVTFFDGLTSLGTTTLSNGVAKVSISSLLAGSHSLTISFAGSPNFNSSTSSPSSLVVNPDDTTTAPLAAPNPTVFGQSVTFTATVSANVPGAGIPTGSVNFYDGLTSLGSVSLVSGVASLSVSSLAVGAHNIVMSYSGDANFNASTNSVTQVVNPAGTANSLTVVPNPTVYGQQATLTATLTAVAPGSGMVAGNVTFYDGATSVATVALSGGVGTFNISSLLAGAHSLTVVYASNGSFSNSTSSVVVLNVGQAATTVSPQAMPNPSVFGQSTIFTATVTAVAPGTGTPTGTVSFFEGTTNLGSSTLTAGVATLTLSSLQVGSHVIQMNYSGDANFLTSNNSLTQLVNQASTTTALATAPNPTVFGQTATMTATVTAIAPGSGTADGSVTFYDGVTTLGTGILTNGVATLNVSNLLAGGHGLVAVYGGSSSFNGSQSTIATQVVNQAATTTAIQSSANPSLFGQGVTLTATISATLPGVGTPTGTVAFFEGVTNLGSVTMNNGVATLAIPVLTVGTHIIAANYSGDGNFLPSTNTLNQVVDPAGTTNVLTVAPNPTVYGQAATLTATVNVVQPGSGTVTGNVTFYEGTTNLGSGALASNVATLNVSSLLAGSHSLTAVYTSNGTFSNSTSVPVTFVVNKAATTSAVVSSLNPSVPGQPVTYTATVNAVAPGAGTPTGTVVFYYNSNKSFGTNFLVSGTASVTNGTLPVGSNLVTAVYSGDANFSTSTTPAWPQTVISLTNSQALAVGTVIRSGTIFLQSGLMVQYFTVSNITAAAYPAVRVTLHLTQTGITVYDATGTDSNGDAYLQYNHPVAAHGSVTLAAEYLVANRTTVPNPTITVSLPAVQAPLPVPAGTMQPVVQSQMLRVQNAFLVGFQTQLNGTYVVTYSGDLLNWTVVVPSVKGTGSEVQWIDLGPPLTQSPPNGETGRYYRIIKTH